MLRYADLAPPPKLVAMAIMVLALITNLIPDPRRPEEEKLVTRLTPSPYPPMIGQMAKARKEIHHHLARITLLTDTTKTRPLPAISPICCHQSIRHSRSIREESSYATMMASEDEVMTPTAETSRHDEKLVELADPSKGSNLTMTMACTAAATRISIAFHAAAMTKGKTPAAMMMIQLHKEQREVVAVAETHCRTSRAKGVTLHHPHQAAPMAAAVAMVAQPSHAAPEKIHRITSPTMPVPT
jgi:hypothetical protein